MITDDLCKSMSGHVDVHIDIHAHTIAYRCWDLPSDRRMFIYKTELLSVMLC